MRVEIDSHSGFCFGVVRAISRAEEALQEQGEVERLLLVGHNPGLERLVALLDTGQTTDYRGMPPAGVAVLALPELPASAAIEPGLGRLTAYWWP